LTREHSLNSLGGWKSFSEVFQFFDICGTWYEIIPFWIIIRHMLGLTDNQLTTVMGMARTLPVEKRDLYLQRIAAMLTMRGRGRFTDSDLVEVVQLARTGLVREPAA
ncbi:MAG: hypothetical protein WA770_07755, partial [Pseudolabrys sp.]